MSGRRLALTGCPLGEGGGAGAGTGNAFGRPDVLTWGLSAGAQGSASYGCSGGVDELCPVMECEGVAGAVLLLATEAPPGW